MKYSIANSKISLASGLSICRRIGFIGNAEIGEPKLEFCPDKMLSDCAAFFIF